VDDLGTRLSTRLSNHHPSIYTTPYFTPLPTCECNLHFFRTIACCAYKIEPGEQRSTTTPRPKININDDQGFVPEGHPFSRRTPLFDHPGRHTIPSLDGHIVQHDDGCEQRSALTPPFLVSSHCGLRNVYKTMSEDFLLATYFYNCDVND
jgi:hypothetical protein